ncbi:MAG: hypothetical protein JJE30_08040 [Desulfuromonadales bacterium]|nr:hypothetical protein [Desulfuromonadales bacterium]
MRKSIAVFIIVCMAFISGCGNTSSSTTTVYSLPTTTTLKPTSRTILGGAIQGVGALSFNNYSVTTFSGSSAGLSDSPANFNRPIGITTDGTNLYVADYFNNAIRQINILSQVVTTIAGGASTGSADGTGTAASFNRPNSITIDGNNNLYVTDSGNYTIRKIVLPAGASGAVVSTLAGGVGTAGSVDAVGLNARFNSLNGITTDNANLYVTDSNNTIRRVDLLTSMVTTLAGIPGKIGSTDCGPGAQATALFNQPARITTDGPSLYVADFANSTIRKIDLASGTVSTIAGKAGPGGVAGSHADSTDGTGLTARFNQPNGITIDDFNLYVTDSYDNTVRKIVLSTGFTTTIAGNPGVAGLADASSTSATFNTPIGITTDGISLYITDIVNHRIRKIH